MSVRAAVPADTEAIVGLVNDAYRVESFFVGGDRVTAADVGAIVRSGECLVIDGLHGVAACIHLSVADEPAYFGMLAVSPGQQGRGLGRALIDEAEDRARAAGRTTMHIKVVNLRTELIGFYERLGYRVIGTEPYVHRPVLQPCHFVTMEKPLV